MPVSRSAEGGRNSTRPTTDARRNLPQRLRSRNRFEEFFLPNSDQQVVQITGGFAIPAALQSSFTTLFQARTAFEYCVVYSFSVC